MLSEKIAKEFLKKAAELQHLQCSCDGCAKRLAECINVEVLAIDVKNTALKTSLQVAHDKIEELTILEPGTTYIAGAASGS